jgi:hypothetical protein
MKTLINHQLISQTVIDSGELAMLGAVIHNFTESGKYRVEILSEGLVVATHILRVDEKSTAMQVNIDLAPPPTGTSDRTASGCDCKDQQSRTGGDAACYTISPRGHASFYVSRGTDGYAVQVSKVNDPRIVFDSRQLQEGDLFAVTLLRPGSYSITNVTAGYKSEVVVAYPKPGRVPFKAAAPVSIEATKHGLMIVADGREEKIGTLGIEATQGQLFKIKTPSRIRIELITADDGPSERRPASVLSWNRQSGAARIDLSMNDQSRDQQPMIANAKPPVKKASGSS